MANERNLGEIVVIGGGLGGLAAAALLARAGHAVRVLEAASQPGGRARSRVQDGYVLNLGAHALYCGGPAQSVLRELGIVPSGRKVEGPGAYALHGDRLHPLPRDGWTLLRSDLLSARGKLSFARLMLTLGERKARAQRGRNVREWIERESDDPVARALLAMLVRLTCYAHAPELLGAETAMRQLAGAVANGVMYVDGGWQSMLDALRERALAAGVQLELGVAADRIEHAGGVVNAVVLRDGRRLPAAAVIAAVEPAALASFLPGDARTRRWAEAAVPLRAACLDLGVRGALPNPEALNVQALDAPLYYSNHSAYSRLAPDGCSVLQLIRYLAPGEDGRDAEPELRAFLERVQPGVYARAEVTRFVPNLVVHNDVPGPERARGEHPELAGLHLVGDGCSARALLSDGVLDSARAAAERIAARMPVLRAASSSRVPAAGQSQRDPALGKAAQARDPGCAA